MHWERLQSKVINVKDAVIFGLQERMKHLEYVLNVNLRIGTGHERLKVKRPIWILRRKENSDND